MRDTCTRVVVPVRLFPPKRGLVLTVCACVKFSMICQIPYVRYTYSGNLLLAKTIICIISVVKANCVKDKAATDGVWREISISVAPSRPFWKNNLLLSSLIPCCEKIILPHLRSSI